MEISNEKGIGFFYHCSRCQAGMPEGETSETWGRLSVGTTAVGLQVWCVRHNCNVAHIHFKGHVLTANMNQKNPIQSPNKLPAPGKPKNVH